MQFFFALQKIAVEKVTGVINLMFSKSIILWVCNCKNYGKVLKNRNLERTLSWIDSIFSFFTNQVCRVFSLNLFSQEINLKFRNLISFLLMPDVWGGFVEESWRFWGVSNNANHGHSAKSEANLENSFFSSRITGRCAVLTCIA